MVHSLLGSLAIKTILLPSVTFGLLIIDLKSLKCKYHGVLDIVFNYSGGDHFRNDIESEGHMPMWQDNVEGRVVMSSSQQLPTHACCVCQLREGILLPRQGRQRCRLLASPLYKPRPRT